MTDLAPLPSLDPRQRIAVLVHWMKGLGVIQGTALDGAEMAGRVASHDGHLHLAPAWVKAWEEAGSPLHGIELPPPPSQKTPFLPHIHEPEEDTPEVKALTALMDPLDTFLLDNKRITEGESEIMLSSWWALHDVDHEKAMGLLVILDRLLRQPKKAKAKSGDHE